ncbi:MAG: RCC1 repeat-containing protein [Gammaproteobacteria bacterium]
MFGAWMLLWALFGFAPTQAATLNSIDITPANPSLDVAQTQAFVATGTFSDSSTQVLDSVATQISANYYDTCELLADGKVICWGGNENGQLGDGSTTGSIVPVTVSGITTASAIATGYYSTCALLADGTVKCWGDNQYGQLGNGNTNPSLTPVAVSGITTATAITVGYGHACALLADKTVWCWGDNSAGQLGNGTTNDSPIAVQVQNISTAMEITAGFQHTCARLSDQTIRCWGDNSSGQLGNGGTSPSSTPVPVSGIDGTTTSKKATGIAAGYGHTCALLANKTVWCWGKNSYGQLGNGGYTESDAPVMVSGIDGTTIQATAIAVGQNHSCALLSGGAEQCWGFNYYGQLGNSSTTSSNVPVSVSGISSATALTAGNFHSCALLSSGQVQCWGNNRSGQLGNGVAIQSTTPVNVSSISAAAAVTAGYSHSCALMSDGTVECWGYNQYGQLGNGSSIQQSSTPVLVSGIGGLNPKAIAVAAGAFHTCALLSDNTVACWGYNQ